MKKIIISLVSISLSLVLGFGAGGLFHSQAEEKEGSHAGAIKTTSLEEELSFSKVIIRGTVIEELPTFVQDAGLDPRTNFKFPVTPSKIKVTKVLEGDVKVDDAIVFLQHGDRETEKNEFVKSGDDVILILNKRTDGKYWSYAYEDGVWNIKNGKVTSKTNNELYNNLQNGDINNFETRLSTAAKNKVKPKQ
jgi:hypothetical protein